MTGSIRQRGTNGWQIVLDAGHQADGTRRQVYRTVNGPRKWRTVLAALQREIETGTNVDANRLTVCTYSEAWLKTMRPRVSPSTWERYDLALRLNVLPALGNLRLADLRPLHLQTLYSDLLEGGRQDKKGGLSARSVHHVHVIFGGALREAVTLRLLARNPATDARPPRVSSREMLALDRSQAMTLLAKVVGSRVQLPVVLALTCELRRGEILGLRWSDIDLGTRQLSVRRVLVRAASELLFKEPKSAKGTRTVALPELAVKALRAHRAALATERIALGGVYRDQDLVCPAGDGTPWHPCGFANAFRSFMAKQSDLLRFHDLRHTHASLLLQANVPAKVVSERLGHASTGITLDVYSHVLPGMQEDAAAKVDLALGGHVTGASSEDTGQLKSAS